MKYNTAVFRIRIRIRVDPGYFQVKDPDPDPGFFPGPDPDPNLVKSHDIDDATMKISVKFFENCIQISLSFIN